MKIHPAFALAFASLAFGPAVRAANIPVNSLEALQAALDKAGAGDRIVLAAGNYTTSGPIKVTCAGNAKASVVIAAESTGATVIAGAGGFDIAPPAAYVIIDGFTFTHASGTTRIHAGTHHVRFLRNTFECVGEGAYLNVAGDDVEVDRNEFRNKKTLGNMIDVNGTAPQVARRLWIHHNYFHDFTNANGNGAETIRFGLSGLSMSRGEGIVEYNLFVHCEGENELISNKSGANTYRYNTFLDAPGAQLTLRHGNDCIAYGNYFRNTDGLRIFGDRHQVFGNYFEHNKRGINLGNGDGEVADGAKLTSHDRPDGATIAFNTFLDNATTYQMDGRKDGMGATKTTFANNVIQGGGPVAKIDGPNPDAKWSGNSVAKAGPIGNLPESGYAKSQARFVVTGDGHFVTEPGAITPASTLGAYPAAVSLEPLAGGGVRGMTVKILTPADVGPASR